MNKLSILCHCEVRSNRELNTAKLQILRLPRYACDYKFPDDSHPEFVSGPDRTSGLYDVYSASGVLKQVQHDLVAYSSLLQIPGDFLPREDMVHKNVWAL